MSGASRRLLWAVTCLAALCVPAAQQNSSTAAPNVTETPTPTSKVVPTTTLTPTKPPVRVGVQGFCRTVYSGKMKAKENVAGDWFLEKKFAPFCETCESFNSCVSCINASITNNITCVWIDCQEANKTYCSSESVSNCTWANSTDSCSVVPTSTPVPTNSTAKPTTRPSSPTPAPSVVTSGNWGYL
ncbi:Sialomucin core protein 24 [Apodemus speciosus]|uniref:Sialomucin core protein 24 n=1 Tax=Apodemus speciosus TaxID=105296 RepID=A0ABQ0F713_APOSI